MAIGGSLKSRNLLAQKRLQKRNSVRRVLLESLEARQLLAVGPQLLGVQPNSGDLLENGDILQVSPRELVFRFDDAAGIDPSTLDGIRIVRSGEDGVFERASVATDLGTGGQTLVEFYSQTAGEEGNGIEITFSRLSRTDSRAPVVRVDGRTIDIELNTNPTLQTRVEDILQVFRPDAGTPATQLVYALRLRGSTTIPVANTADISRTFVLRGANAAKASTDFGLGNNTEVRFVARDSGNTGLGINIAVTARDRGSAGNPIVTVVGKSISIEINSNPRFPTTIQEFVDAINSNDSLSSALVEAQLVSGAGATRIGTSPVTYSPLVLSGVTDIEIIPAYVGLGDTDREVVLRFAESLPDDRYRIEILGQGTRRLLNVNGESFNGGVSRSVAFELDLGAVVESVVPQPVSRSASGQLTQSRNQIDIYFNNDDLIDVRSIVSVNGVAINDVQTTRSPFFLLSTDTIVFAAGATGSRSVLDTSFYQLFHTNDTLDTGDDVRVLPSSVRYFPDADRVTLTFSRNLDELVVPGTSTQIGPGELRLRVGSNESKPLPPVEVNGLAADQADTFAGAENLGSVWTPGASGSQSVIIDSEIDNPTPLLLDFPGGSDEPGTRNNRHQDNLRLAADSVDGTSVINYNFQNNLGTFSSTALVNAITEQQKQRVREVFSLYEQYLGVRFVETNSLGLTVAVGDTRAISPFEEIAGSGNPGVVELNSVGGNYYEAGFLISNGQLGTVLDVQDFSDSTLNAFAGPFQRAAMQAVGRLLGLGLSDEVAGLAIQSFDAVFAPGVGTEIVLPGDADIVHGQYLYRPDSKDIDLYQFTLPASGRMSIEAFAERMGDASLLDTQIRLYQQNDSGAWDEIASNDDYYSSDSFLELELAQGNYIVGVSASGNASYDPTISDTGIGGRSEGRYQLRMDFQPPAQAVLRDGTGTPIDGDANGTPEGVFNFWFRPSGPSNTKFVDKAAAGGGNGTLAAPYRNIKDALGAASAGDVVRIVGNGGADRRVDTVADNLAYEVGFDTLGNALPDGSTFNVPRDVSVMIDAGAILKMRRARVGVGSTSVNVDRSAGSLLVLGTPKLVGTDGSVILDSTGAPVEGSVFFTSVSDRSLGRNANNAVVGSTASAGDWGGIDFRNRIDASFDARENKEELGQFLNWISHADIRFGGGQVIVDGVSQSITPVQMVDARPTIAFTSITGSSEAAMSATPNSFLESNFHSPAEQGASLFTTDYDRVGPAIYGNTIVGNSINGLQVRVRTTSGSQLETMTVSGRFDDVDIVHYIPENLVISGTPGGAVLTNDAPTSTSVRLAQQPGGTLPAGVYNYRFTTIRNGVESVGSEPSSSVFASGTVALSNLPIGVNRIYRSSASGEGPYQLIAEFNANTTTFVDNGTTIGTVLVDNPIFRNRLDARLAIDAGTIVKSQGSRIDVSLGAQLIAEGIDGTPVVFTSLNDARYGAGGTFDTANRVGSQDAESGDWGGIYVGHTSKASLDNAVLAYGGGTTRIEGGFADFNAIEVHQGDLRLTRSRIELNANGSSLASDPDRAGRGINDVGAIFVLGSQPIIADNIIVNNEGPAISANVSSLNFRATDDYGRSTGRSEKIEGVIGNKGPLVAQNRLDGNQINGFLVRGGILTTEGVWDDVDIVHVVNSEIVVPDYQSYGGLRLLSSGDQSLVVKLTGDEAGFTANGNPIDNANRIGGAIQVVGNPDHPVVLTSIDDCTVGAGFTPTGRHQFDTNGFCTASDSAVIDVVLLLDDTGSFASTGPLVSTIFSQVVGLLETAIPDANFAFGVARYEDYTLGGDPDDRAFILNQPVVSTNTPNFDAAIASALNRNSPGSGGDGPESGIEALWQIVTGSGFDENNNGNTSDSGPAGLVSTQVNPGPGGDVPAFSSFIADPSGPVLPSSGSIGGVGFRPESTKRLVLMATDIGFAFQPDGIDPYIGRDGRTAAAANIQLAGRNTTPNNAGASIQETVDALVANNVEVVGLHDGTIAQTVLSALATLTGAVDSSGNPMVYDIGGATAEELTATLVDAILEAVVGASAGDWRSVLLDTYSNDRNVAVVTEFESPLSNAAGLNETPTTAQHLGGIAPNEKSGDENRRLGFQISGNISQPSDVDVYSFTAEAGTEVWLDIDRTSNSLDSVVELVDADGRTLALSDSSLLEESNPALLFRSFDMPAQSVNPLRKSDTALYFTSAQGAPKDLFSTNEKDAGLRVRLPGEVGSTNLYHVRVRSSNVGAGGSSADLTNPALIAGGLSKGSYQLQVRLNEVDEVPGSGITYADIRFATNGLQLVGVPGNSPLLGENSEIESNVGGPRNDTLATAQPLGNLLQSNRQAISVAGSLDNFTDVDWYSFSLDYQRITPTALREYFATVFDMDYADGIGRPDTSLYVFDSAGNLILGGLGSGLVDDQASPVSGSDNADLSRGSAGGLDPFIGAYELPVGDYFLAVTNSDMVPAVLATFTDPNSTQPNVRLQPIEGLQLIAEDHIGFSGGSSALPPQIPVLFDPQQSVVDFNLSDLNLYVSQDVGQELTNIYLVNPFTGGVKGQVGRGGNDIQDIAFRPNGELRSFDRVIETQAGNVDPDGLVDYINIDTGTAAFTAAAAALQTNHTEIDAAGNITIVASDDGMNAEALTFAVLGGQERGFVSFNRPTPFGVQPQYYVSTGALPNVGNARPGIGRFTNIIYEFDEATGAVTSAPAQDKTGNAVGTGAGTAVRERGFIDTFFRDAAGQPITQSSQLAASEVTQTFSNGQTNFLIRDGQTFSVVDSLGFVTTFEFNLGPEVLVNYDPVTAPVADGIQFQLDADTYEFNVAGGTPGVSPGAIAVPLPQNATLRQFVDSIAQATRGQGVTVSFESGRMNFSGAITSNFSQLTAAGVFTNLGSSGAVSGGNLAIDVLVSDTAETVAARIALATNVAGLPGLSASSNGQIVQFFGALVQDSGSLAQVGVAPGGIVTGLAVIGGTMFAVSDEGGLWSVNLGNDGNTFFDSRPVSQGGDVEYKVGSFGLTGIHFTGLVAGPRHASNGELSQLLFGLDINGNIHAFDTNGALQPVFANGATSISTGLSNVNGLALPSLDFNLWHATGQRAGDAGHGLPATPNASRTAVNGGTSLYFGFENAGANGVGDLQGANATGLANSYNFPGGAAGAMESATFSLEGISAADLPTLYFSYRFDTEGAASDRALGSNPDDYMRDSFRVYASGEDGEWVLLATNNDPAQGGSNVGFLDDEFDAALTGNSDVQPLFDNVDQWRQARVPLDVFAGQPNVKLRVEFSSSGGFGYGLRGGKGPEIRTVGADKLSDGEAFVINGETFEIEMGPTLTLPAGAALASGNTVTVDGVNYIFTDGTGPAVVAPDVPVLFNASMNSEEVAAALFAAINGNTVVPPTVGGLTFTNESNETINFAELTPVNGDTIRVVGSGTIGDNATLANASEDVDLVRVDVEAGASITVDVQAATIGSGLDSFLRVFDSEGRPLRNAAGQLIQNDNRVGSSDSRLTFVAPESGSYYIGVSAAGNQVYNAAVSTNAVAAATSGNYSLSITVQRRLAPTVAGNRLQLDGARNVTVSAGSSISLQGGLGTTGQPINISVDMTRAEVAQAVQQGIANFFSNGVSTAYPIRGGDTIELTGLVSYSLIDPFTGLPTPSASDFDSGPFGGTTTFVGDAFSAFNTGTRFDGTTDRFNPGTLGAQNNDFEGLYVDDFIIGLAGRGEMVLNAAPDTTFVVDPQKALSNPDQPNLEILLGAYQFEIRGGQEYGLPLLDGFPQTLALLDSVSPGERLSPGISLQFNAAATLIAGTTFTVGDGTRVLTFELDDANDGVGVQPGNIALQFNTTALDPATGTRRSESAEVIAARFRDIINSQLVQEQVAISAVLSNNDRVGATSDTVVLIGQASAEIPSSVGSKIVSQAKGGSNRERSQGQVVINAARITNSLDFGITVSSAARDSVTNATLPGSPRNLITTNTDNLAPGAVIVNSELAFNNAGGISVQGDAGGAGLPQGAVPFVRLVNNTIVGGTVRSVTRFTPVIAGDVLFDIGDLAFADSVVSYQPLIVGGPAPIAGLNDPLAALGAPDFTGSGEPLANEGVVSLGRGGRLVVEFTNNLLTGSGDANPDLVIFEVGDSEEAFVEVSADGNLFTAVGRVSAAQPTVDLDAFGFNENSRLTHVRLTDLPTQGASTGDSVGADIDAVGAISSVPADVYAPGGQGITVTNNASATLLNNVLVNNSVGINVDASSASTIVGGTIYQRNSANVSGSATLGEFSTAVGANVPVFVSVGTGNFYPAPSSPLIDSSIDSLEDRPSLVAVKAPVGIAASPILAPQFDISGQLRVDDPAVETPSGLGENVFKDRGARDRADFTGPSVILQSPIDNDLAGVDGNPLESIVELSGVTPLYFDIQLLDGLEPSDPNAGSGINSRTVSSASVLVYRNNVPLVEGIDYRFGYDSTNHIIRLQPIAGIWKSESVYTVRFLNAGESVIVASNAAAYTDGDQFEVIDASGSRTSFEIDLGYLVSVPTTDGVNADVIDAQSFTVDDGTRRLTFEFDNDGSVGAGSIAVSIDETPSIQSVGRAIQAAILASGLSVQVSEVADGRLQLQGSRSVQVLPELSGLIVAGSTGTQSAFGIQIPLEAGRPAGIEDGQTFTIDRSGDPVSFEIDTNGTTLPGNIPVRVLANDSAAAIGAALVQAINVAAIGLSPSYDGAGFVRLGGDVNTRLDLTNTVLTQSGLPGVPATVAIVLDARMTATEVATLVKSRVEAAGLSGVTLTQFGSRLVIEGAAGVAGTGAGQIAAIRDLAGNPLKANQEDGTTQITIFLGDGLDYGDAPAPYASTAAENGPRHTVVSGLSIGATVSADADARISNLDSDDGVTFSGLFAAFQSNAQISVTNTTGQNAYLTMWIDFNGDGFFETAERRISSQLVTQPTTTVSFTVPATATVGETYARVRLSTDPNAVATPVGAAPDGEVEDVLITIQGNPYTNLDDALDVNGDGFVSPIDVLQVINWINDPTKPNLLSLSAATNRPPFIDVTGDGIVSALDASRIINFLNSRPASGEGEYGGALGSGLDFSFSGSQETVLASNWAPGLENLLGTTKSAHASEPVQNLNDLALLEDDSSVDLGLVSFGVGYKPNSVDEFWSELGGSVEDDESGDAGSIWDSLD